MNTKAGIGLSLKLLGENGYQGVYACTSSPLDALLVTLSTIPDIKPVIERVAIELRRQDLVVMSCVNEGYTITITPKGAYRLLSILVNEVGITTPAVWDQRWRLVSFDIPTGKDKERAFLNRRLHELNFCMLQKSMWIHPYECSNAVTRITDYLNLTRYVVTMEIVELDEASERKLLKYFSSTLNLND